MKIADIQRLPEGTQLKTKAGLVTLTGTVRAVALVRGEDGQTREVRGVSLSIAADPYPLVTGHRPGLVGHTVTVERATRSTARMFAETVRDWEGLIGRLCAVERTDGRLGKVCAVAGVDGLGDGEDDVVFAASSAACVYGARYVPAGS